MMNGKFHGRNIQKQKGRQKPRTVAGGSHKIQKHRKSTDRENSHTYSSTTDKVPTSPDDSRTREGNANENSPTGSLQSKPNEFQLVISYEIERKIHQWAFCREMSENHLGDANGSSDCVPISLSLCKMFCSSNSFQIPQSVDIWRSSVCNSIVEGRHMYDKISVTPDEYFSFIEFCDMGHSANEHFKKYPWKSLNIEKVEYDLIVNVGDTDHAIRPYYPTFCNKNQDLQAS